MRTDQLIAMLASNPEVVEPRVWRRRYALALGAGVVGATLLMVMLLGVRPDLAAAARLPMFWVKLAFPAVLAAVALLVAMRLSRPGVQLGRLGSALAAPVLAMWLLGAVALIGAAPEDRGMLIWGETWAACLVNVTLLSMPALVALLWVMKTLAPTQPAWAGAAAGLLAGALGATVYALHCPEMDAPFLGVWYLLGMLIPAAVGAVVGSRLLRW